MTIAIKKRIKDVMMNAFPKSALKVFSIRSRRMIETQARELGLDSLAREVALATGSAVAAGPFTGMKLDYELLPVHTSPKFLGTYEQELHNVIERAIQLSPRYVLNVGCAEGFYAVGLAIRINNAHVYAADADPKALSATLKNAALNGVSARVHPAGIVKRGEFDKYLRADSSLLVMDCEGAEFNLLDPSSDPILLRTNILVEIHPEFGDKRDIIRRFVQTHTIKDISYVVRATRDISIGPINGVDLLSAADERRVDGQSWLFFELKSDESSQEPKNRR